MITRLALLSVQDWTGTRVDTRTSSPATVASIPRTAPPARLAIGGDVSWWRTGAAGSQVVHRNDLVATRAPRAPAHAIFDVRWRDLNVDLGTGKVVVSAASMLRPNTTATSYVVPSNRTNPGGMHEFSVWIPPVRRAASSTSASAAGAASSPSTWTPAR